MYINLNNVRVPWKRPSDKEIAHEQVAQDDVQAEMLGKERMLQTEHTLTNAANFLRAGHRAEARAHSAHQCSGIEIIFKTLDQNYL